ncbi:MAG: hypothetical protein ABI867_03705 [Kofleriaceae bacterium]
MTRLIALFAVLGLGGCAHKQLTNREVAQVAVYAGGVAVFLAASVMYCHSSCNTQ